MGHLRFMLAGLLLGLALVGHIALNGDPMGDGPAFDLADGGQVPLEDKRAAVLAVVGHFAEEGLAALQRPSQAVQFLPVGLGALQDPGRLADHLLGGVASHSLEGWIDEHDARPGRLEIGFGDDHRLVDLFDGGLNELQRVLGFLAVGDVAGGGLQFLDLAAGAAQRSDGAFHPQVRAVVPAFAEDHGFLVGLAGGQPMVQVAEHGQVVGVDGVEWRPADERIRGRAHDAPRGGRGVEVGAVGRMTRDHVRGVLGHHAETGFASCQGLTGFFLA